MKSRLQALSASGSSVAVSSHYEEAPPPPQQISSGGAGNMTVFTALGDHFRYVHSMQEARAIGVAAAPSVCGKMNGKWYTIVANKHHQTTSEEKES